MALARYKPFAESTVEPEVTKAVPAPYSGITQENSYDSKVSLLRYVEGSSWTVNYYRQVVATHNDIKPLDTQQDALYQQYEEIVGLELKVSTPLSQGSQEKETGFISVEGSAIVYPHLIPNAGDMFIADVGDGRDALFIIREVNRSSYRKDSVFQIDYTLKYYIDPAGSTLKDLRSKTINTFYFEKDMLLNNKTPLLIEDEYRFMNEAKSTYHELVDYYFTTFWDSEFSTLILPQTHLSVYDPFVVDFILRIVNTNESSNIRLTKNLVTMDDLYLKQHQIYSILLNRTPQFLSQANQKMGLVNPLHFSNNPTLRGIRFTYITDVVYPLSPDISANNWADLGPKLISDRVLVETPSALNKFNITHELYVENTLSIPYIYPVLEDEYYVLSKNFYENVGEKSILEILVKDYLRGNAIDVKKMWALIKRWGEWGRLEQFYYIPILILLTKAARWGVK